MSESNQEFEMAEEAKQDSSQTTGTHLDLSEQDLSGMAVEDVVTQFGAIAAEVTSLDLSSNCLGDSEGLQNLSDLDSIFRAIPTSITSLNLSSNLLGQVRGNTRQGERENGIQTLFELLPELTSIDISYNGFDEAIGSLANIIIHLPASLVTIKLDEKTFSQLNAEELQMLSEHFKSLENVIIVDEDELAISRAKAGRLFMFPKHRIVTPIENILLPELTPIVCGYLDIPTLQPKSWQACLDDIEELRHSDFILLIKALIRTDKTLSRTELARLEPYIDTLTAGLDIMNKKKIKPQAKVPDNALVQLLIHSSLPKLHKQLQIAGGSAISETLLTLSLPSKPAEHKVAGTTDFFKPVSPSRGSEPAPVTTTKSSSSASTAAGKKRKAESPLAINPS